MPCFRNSPKCEPHVFKIEPWFWEFKLLLQICFHLFHLFDNLYVYGLTNVKVLKYMILQCFVPPILKWLD
jgi:hypothetical protein